MCLCQRMTIFLSSCLLLWIFLVAKYVSGVGRAVQKRKRVELHRASSPKPKILFHMQRVTGIHVSGIQLKQHIPTGKHRYMHKHKYSKPVGRFAYIKSRLQKKGSGQGFLEAHRHRVDTHPSIHLYHLELFLEHLQ